MFCQNWFHWCNLPYYPSVEIDVGSCLKCNCELFPLSICNDINSQDKSLNYLHYQYRSLIPFQKQSLETNMDVKCRYTDCDDFKSIYSSNSYSGLSFLHLNICSLAKNFDMLTNFLDSLNFEFGVIGISETRILNSSIPHNLEIQTTLLLLLKLNLLLGALPFIFQTTWHLYLVKIYPVSFILLKHSKLLFVN